MGDELDDTPNTREGLVEILYDWLKGEGWDELAFEIAKTQPTAEIADLLDRIEALYAPPAPHAGQETNDAAT